MEKTEKKVKTVKRKKKAIKLKSGDFWLMLFTLMLVIFGVIMVFSASYYYSISQDGNAYSYLLRHGMWVLLGFGVMILGAAFDYRRYKKFALPIFIASVLLLILVLTPLGQTTNGATRWIRLGPVTIMPGEIAKIAAIMFVAWFLSEDRDRIKSLTRGILPLVGVAGLYGALIIMQPNLSTAITVCGIIVAMMLVAGLKWRYVLTAGGVGAAGILSILLFMKDSYGTADSPASPIRSRTLSMRDIRRSSRCWLSVRADFSEWDWVRASRKTYICRNRRTISYWR